MRRVLTCLISSFFSWQRRVSISVIECSAGLKERKWGSSVHVCRSCTAVARAVTRRLQNLQVDLVSLVQTYRWHEYIWTVLHLQRDIWISQAERKSDLSKICNSRLLSHTFTVQSKTADTDKPVSGCTVWKNIILNVVLKWNAKERLFHCLEASTCWTSFIYSILWLCKSLSALRCSCLDSLQS